MNLHSPVVAMLWENWRLSRVEAAQRVGLSIAAGSGALLLFDNGATVAFWIVILQFSFIYFSIAKLNGGRFMDGYKPGFPLYLLYTRPVPTSVLVGVAVAYDALSSAVLYVAIALLLGYAFDQAYPLLPVVVLIVVYHLGYACVQYATRSRAAQWIGSIVITLPAFFLLYRPGTSPQQLEFLPIEYVLLTVLGVVFFALTVAGVARQRRGDSVANVPRSARSAGSVEYPEWLLNLFRFQCPTSSATRAQMWFELKSSGLPVLAIGLGLALLILVLFAIGIYVEVFRMLAIASVMLSGPILLVVLGSNAFGIRRRQGHAFASAFEMTQPYGVSRLVGVKWLVRTACVLLSLVVVSVSVWASSSFMTYWGTWLVEGGKNAVPGLLEVREEFGESFAGTTGRLLLAQSVIIAILVALMIASFSVLAVIRARYPRRLFIAGALLLGYVITLVALAVARLELVPWGYLAAPLLSATGWILLAAMAATTIYLAWNGFAERYLSIRYVCVALLVTLAFGAAWLTVLHAGGMELAAMPAIDAIKLLWPILLPLMISVVAPWSLSRIRHM